MLQYHLIFHLKHLQLMQELIFFHFGGTKNGMMFGEAICFLKPGLSNDFKYIRKQGMQLASKMRFISAQYIAYFRNDLWKKCASHSNAMARILAEKLQQFNEIRITQAVQSNGVFVIMPLMWLKKCRNIIFSIPGMKRHQNTG